MALPTRWFPFDGPGKKTPKFITFKSVEDSIQTWVTIDGCDKKPEIAESARQS